jgi:hypothetical protein
VSWRQRSACLGLDAELFFPSRGDADGVEAALAVCATCPADVVELCLTDGLEQKDGILGATTAAQRRKIREQRPKVRSCLHCGALFEGRMTAGFCSDRCRETRRRIKQRESAARVGGAL